VLSIIAADLHLLKRVAFFNDCCKVGLGSELRYLSCVACWNEKYPTRITSQAATMRSREQAATPRE